MPQEQRTRRAKSSSGDVQLQFRDPVHRVIGGVPERSRGRGREPVPPDLNPHQSRRLLSDLTLRALEFLGSARSETGMHRHRHIARLDAGTVVSVVNVLTFSGASTVAVIFLMASRQWILQWLKNQASRSVYVKWGNEEIRITGTNDLEKALMALQSLETRTTTHKRSTPTRRVARKPGGSSKGPGPAHAGGERSKRRKAS